MSSLERSDIRVVVDTGDHYSVHLETAGDYDISIIPGDNYHVIVETPTTTVENADIYFRVADLALTAISSSFAETASFALSAAGTVTSSDQVIAAIDGQDITPSSVTSSFFGPLIGTASIADNIGVIFAGEYQTGSDTPVIIDPTIGLIKFVPVILPEVLDGGGATIDSSSIILDGGGA
jgi:hypothetical protein